MCLGLAKVFEQCTSNLATTSLNRIAIHEAQNSAVHRHEIRTA